MTPEETAEGWARKVVVDGQWLFHTSTLVVGTAVEFFDGKEKVHVSTVNGAPVDAPVIKLSNGHSFLANPNAFIELESREVEFYKMATEKLTEFSTAAAVFAATHGLAMPTTVMLLCSLFRAQLAALETPMRPQEAIG